MACYLRTNISEFRQSTGQPSSELIAYESHVKNKGIAAWEFIETARFGDWKLNGGDAVRYYHLLDHKHGAALCLDEGGHGNGRILFGFYENRTLQSTDSAIYDIASKSEHKDKASLIDALHSASFIRHESRNGDILSSKINCIEFFDTHVNILSSLRIPLCLYPGNSSSEALTKILKKSSKQTIDQLRARKEDVTAIKAQKFLDLRVACIYQHNSKKPMLFITANGITIKEEPSSSLLLP